MEKREDMRHLILHAVKTQEKAVEEAEIARRDIIMGYLELSKDWKAEALCEKQEAEKILSWQLCR